MNRTMHPLAGAPLARPAMWGPDYVFTAGDGEWVCQPTTWHAASWLYDHRPPHTFWRDTWILVMEASDVMPLAEQLEEVGFTTEV